MHKQQRGKHLNKGKSRGGAHERKSRGGGENRASRATIAEQTVKCLQNGFYLFEGRQIPLQMKQAYEGTVLYTPKDELSFKADEKKLVSTVVEVAHESTLETCFRLCVTDKVERVAALNFASARNPGGGLLCSLCLSYQ